MQKVFSKDVFIDKKVNELVNDLKQNNAWLDVCDGLTRDEMIKVGYIADKTCFVDEDVYNEIKNIEKFEEEFNNTEDQVFVGSKEDIVEMILKDNQTIVFDCKKISEHEFKIEYKYVNFGD